MEGGERAYRARGSAARRNVDRYLLLDESIFPLGISRVGGVHLFSRFNVIVDDPFWPAPIQATIGRCPNGQGSLVPLGTPTKGAANTCPETQAR